MLPVLVGVLGLAGLLLAWSPGRPAPLSDDAGRPIDGSISARVFTKINGVRQGMIIQTSDISHPVLLFLHGGPGMPEFFLNTTHPSGLEKDFTVVWWEQRGAGLSYRTDTPGQSTSFDQLIGDTIAVTNYLRQRFGQDKIYLLGHSWGSFLGIQVVAAAPELFHAYIGMGQVSHQLRSEVTAHRYMTDQYRARGDRSMVRRLEAAPASMSGGHRQACRAVFRQAISACGTTRCIDLG
ncbi:alpha/beta fold hydrolase [Arthrobacter sp. CG_A4]|uniref:alpha/beta fold hydrolase n=1 Tax=Arthrobacter sp. CG_A4 TaxID=3071706 RepID=UPI002E11E811